MWSNCSPKQILALVIVASFGIAFAQEPPETPELDTVEPGGVSPGAAHVHPADPAASVPPVDIVSIQAPGVERPLYIVTFFAPSIGRTTKYMVLLPDGYENNPEKRYPVLYLLHGFSQNYTVWPMMGAAEHSSAYDLIVIMPDGGNSWYVNWADSESGQLNNWEDFIAYDLVEHVDTTFRTITQRFGRAINGLSMGGYGAIAVGLRHPDLFCSIGSHSGALEHARIVRQAIEGGMVPSVNAPPPDIDSEKDANVPPLIEIPDFTRQSQRYPNAIEFKTVEDCNAYDPFELVKILPIEALPHIYLDCGLEDGLISSTQEFAALLMERKIPFTFGQTPGGHNRNYWEREVSQSIAVQYNIMRLALNSLALRAMPQPPAEAQAAPTDKKAVPAEPATP